MKNLAAGNRCGSATGFCPRVRVDEDFLPRSCIKGDYDFSDLKTASPFYPEAYAFPPGNRQSTRIYSYTYS